MTVKIESEILDNFCKNVLFHLKKPPCLKAIIGKWFYLKKKYVLER